MGKFFCEICDVQVPGPLPRCSLHLHIKLAYHRKKITLQKTWVEMISKLEPDERYNRIKVMAIQIGVTQGAIYLHLRKHFNFKKVGKYLVYAGITEDKRSSDGERIESTSSESE